MESGYIGKFQADWVEKFMKEGRGPRYLTMNLSFEGESAGEAVDTFMKNGRLLTAAEKAGETDEILHARLKRLFATQSSGALEVDEASVAAMLSVHPTNIKKIPTLFEALDKASVAEKKISNRLMVGLSVAAGAMLMMGASKLFRGQPITEKDVPAGQYGSMQHDGPTGPGRMYTPQARIVQNNSGYMTNINVEASDMDGNADSRSMASSMGAISASVTGIRNINTSLHVTDDSSRMDMESVRRQMNRQLSQ